MSMTFHPIFWLPLVRGSKQQHHLELFRASKLGVRLLVIDILFLSREIVHSSIRRALSVSG
jgi:hypothetical protein